MFGGSDDPFGFGVFGHMQRQMREMDRMMNAMMEPTGFGMRPMLGMHPMLEDGFRSQRNARPEQSTVGFPMSPFGSFGGIFSAMNHLQSQAMNDPQSHIYMQSTTMTFDEHGRPRVVEKSTRKAGDVREDRRRVRDHEIEEMEIGHSIGNRKHVIEKKRDKDGIIRSQQRFTNLDEADAHDFDREFQSRVRSNVYGRQNCESAQAITDGTRRNGRRYARSNVEENNTPIITLPEEEEDSSRSSSTRNAQNGPIIREISDEEADSSIPKRRRGTFF